MSKPRPIHNLHRDLRSDPDEAEPSFSYERESFMGSHLDHVEDEFHKRLQASYGSRRRDSNDHSNSGGGAHPSSGVGGGGSASASSLPGGSGGGGGGGGGGPGMSSFWRSTASSGSGKKRHQSHSATSKSGASSGASSTRSGGGAFRRSTGSLSNSASKKISGGGDHAGKGGRGGSGAAGGIASAMASAMASGGGGGGGGGSSSYNGAVGNRTATSMLGVSFVEQADFYHNDGGDGNDCNQHDGDGKSGEAHQQKQPPYRTSDSFGSAGSNHSAGKDKSKNKKDIAKQRAAERLRKIGAQTAEVDIGHIVDDNDEEEYRHELTSAACEAHQYHQSVSNVASAAGGTGGGEGAAATSPQHHPSLSSSPLGSTFLLPSVSCPAPVASAGSLDRSSSDQSTGSLFYGKTPNSGAVLGKSSSLIFPTGVETIEHFHGPGGGPCGGGGMHGAGGPGGRHQRNNDENDPQTEAKRRRINLLLDQCESVRFPFKKKLMLNNLSLTANDIPLGDLCGTSLGNSLFKLSLAGNRLGTVPAQLVQNLPTLKHLDLSQCELHQLPDQWNLPKLTRLNLSHNRLTDFPEEGMLEGLPELHELNMYGNKVAEIIIPSGRNLLAKLESLNLGYNDLAYLPDDLDQLTALKTLKVMNNFLEKVPMRVCDMELKGIDVSSNPVIQPPIETCERGISAMKRYYHCLRMEEQSKQRQMEEKQRKAAALAGVSVSGSVATASSASSGMTKSGQVVMPSVVPSKKTKDLIGKKMYGAASLLKSLRRTSDDSNQSVDSTGRLKPTSFSSSARDISVPKPAVAPVRSISLPEPAVHLKQQQKQQQWKGQEQEEPPKSPPRGALQESLIEEEEEDFDMARRPVDAATSPPEGVAEISKFEVYSSSHKLLEAAKHQSSIVVPEPPASEPAVVTIQPKVDKMSVSESVSPVAASVQEEDAFTISQESAATTVNDTLKVIFVGMAMVGKTSMIKRLIEGRDAIIPTHDERTVGVDIYEWDPKKDRRFEDIDSRIVFNDNELCAAVGDVDVKFSVWDFAGQHVYHATHELFFSPRALYVLVWDMGATNRDTLRRRNKAPIGIADAETGAFKLTYDSSDDEEDEAEEPDFAEEEEARRADRALERDIDEKVQFWVDCIQSSAPGAAILPVASFSDYFEEDGGDAEAKRRCNLLKQRLLKHEERRLKGIKERLRELTEQKRANDLTAVRLRKLLCAYTRPKLIFGDGEDDSVVRVSGTKYTGFYELTQKIISIATGRETSRRRYPIFQGHVGARIPNMRLQVRDAVRTMRDRFKVVEWGYFINQLRDRGLTSVEDISDALFFLTNIGELSYFGGIEASGKEHSNPVLEREDNEAGITDDEEEEDEYDDEQAILSMDDTSITAPSSTSDGSTSTVDDFMSTGLSQFVFLNPRWLVAAVACILRHDLDREIKETRRQASIAGPRQLTHQGSFYEAHLNCPVITADDACLLWQAKRITKKAAERAQEYSNNMTMTPFEFLQQLLIRFGVFVPIDLSIEKAFLGGKEYAHLVSETEEISYDAPSDDNAKFFFLPSLLGPCEPSDAWTYKSNESWKTTLCHSVLFPDGVPPGLMERLTASVLSSIYDVAHRREIVGASTTDFYGQRVATYEGQLTVKEVLCWRTAFFIKLGAKAQSPDGSFKESIVEIFTHIADRESHLCVGSDYMGVGMRRLIVSGKGQVGDGGRKIWKGGYLLVVKCINRVMDNYGGLEYERHGFCPECLAKKAVSEASSWEFTKVRSAVMNAEGTLRCQHGHRVDTRLIAGPSDNLQKDKNVAAVDPVQDPVVPVRDLLRAVVVVGLWDGKAQKVVRVGSGFIVDRKRGLIVTAAHTLMNIWGDKNYPFGENYYGLRQGKVVIGVIPDDKEVDGANGKDMAVFRYFAKIVSKDPSLDNGECRLDACVLKITTRMENDVGGDGEGCGDQPEKLLLNDPRALKNEHLQSLKMTEKCELDEQVRILGYNQGGEGLLSPGEELNRYVDFARGYVCKFHHGQQDAAKSATSGGGGASADSATGATGTGAAQQGSSINGTGGGASTGSNNTTGSSVGGGSAAGGARIPQRDLFKPRSEYVVICPTISGHSGGPVVNQQGEVIGILSRADPAENQRCYIAPTSEWKPLVKQAKNAF